MTADVRMKNIYDDLEKAYGLGHKTVDRFKALHLDTLKQYVEEVDGADIGGMGIMIAADETTISKDIPTSTKPKGFKPKPRGKFSRRNPLLVKVLPGRTVWRRPSTLKRPAAFKRPAASKGRATRFWKQKAGTKDDKRSNSQWQWMGVEIGTKSGEKKSHKLGNKRVTIGLLPRREDAPHGKPRGKVALTRMFTKRVNPGNKVVADEWTATPPAVAAAKSKVVGSVSHRKGFRNPVTGYHSNDAESEVGRYKFFLKKKNGWIRSSNAGTKRKKDVHLERHIAEYMFYTNVGREMTDIMAAYKHRYKVDCQKFNFGACLMCQQALT